MNIVPPAPDRSLRNRMLYAGCRGVVLLAGKLGWAVRAYDTDRVPDTGPVILAPTHRSFFDIPFMGFVTARPARFMAKAELFEHRGIGWFISQIGALPVRRGHADRAALAASFSALDQGAPLVVFPEGTRRSGPDIDHIEDGVAYLAMKTGAPIVPIGVAGTEEILTRRVPRFTNVVMCVGNPIPVTPSEGRLDRVEMRAVVEQVRAGLQQEFDRAQELRIRR